MKLRLVSIVLVGLLAVSCGSSSVYQLPDAQQKGLTYQTYQESPDEVFDAVSEVLKTVNDKRLMQKNWEIKSSDKNAGSIETEWKKIGGSGSDDSDSNNEGSGETAGQPEMDGTGSVSGGRVLGSGSNERFKLNVEITEQGSGSKVSLQLQKQVKMSEWRTFDVTQKTARNHLQPLLNQLDGNLSPQDS